MKKKRMFGDSSEDEVERIIIPHKNTEEGFIDDYGGEVMDYEKLEKDDLIKSKGVNLIKDSPGKKEVKESKERKNRKDRVKNEELKDPKYSPQSKGKGKSLGIINDESILGESESEEISALNKSGAFKKDSPKKYGINEDG